MPKLYLIYMVQYKMENKVLQKFNFPFYSCTFIFNIM